MKCKNCGSLILTDIKICPCCGVPIKHKNPGCVIFLLLIFLLVIWITYQGFIDDKRKAEQKQIKILQAIQMQKDAKIAAEKEKIEKAQQKVRLEQKKREQEKKRAEEYELCKQNLQCWGDKHLLSATVASQDIIERYAKYQFKWTDGWLGSKMTQFRWKDKEQSILTYLGDKIMFQNGFGAWQNMTYQCDYDPIKKELLSIQVYPGRL